MPIIFINFRAHDQAGYASLLDRILCEEFGREAVFFSSRSIRPGEDFATEILRNLRLCAVLLVVIGPNWLAHAKAGLNADGQPVDWVYREIAEAFKVGVRVIPVLVESVVMPRDDELPRDVTAMSRCQYLRLHHRNVPHDLVRILEEIKQAAPELTGQRRPASLRQALAFRLAPPGTSPCTIGVIAGTILRVTTIDIWVSSENTDMEMSRFNDFSLSGIVRYWGSQRDATGHVIADDIARELAERVGAARPVAAGSVIVTGAGSLASSNGVRYLFHVAAVQGEPGAGFRQVTRVDRCVVNVLTEADRVASTDRAVRTILLPLLGTGTAGADVPTTVTAMVDAAVDYLVSHPHTRLRGISLLAYTDRELAALERTLATSPRLTLAPS